MIVLDHPPELFELPFTVGKGLGFPGAEGVEEDCVGVLEICFAGESCHRLRCVCAEWKNGTVM